MPPSADVSRPELLAPAGDWDCLRAAVANGADAVFFGMPRFNARMRADNFREEELPEVMRFLHAHGVKGYVTLNVLIFTGELPDAVAELALLNRCGVDAVIIQDVGLAEIARQMFPGLRVHASTQMTITSPEGVAFAGQLGVKQVVLARELSLREIKKFHSPLPLEVFVHGALCVAYSGQCLTSESLGQRSANRGECAQACRMPYELVVDGALRDLGDKRYLLSPQDLAAVREIPELIELGVKSFKIEGRLKSADYVAAVTQVYRKAIDAALNSEIPNPKSEISPADWYKLEMTFSRGLFSGWMHGVNHQKLVSARFGKKRGPFAGRVTRVGRGWVEVANEIPLRRGDGVVFDTGGDTNQEQGGRIYEIAGRRLSFEHGKMDFRKIAEGARVWKTDDPVLEKELLASFQGRIPPREAGKRVVHFSLRGAAGESLEVTAECEARRVHCRSEIPLQAALRQPLTAERAREQFAKLADTPFILGSLDFAVTDAVMLPMSELNRLRRETAAALERRFIQPPSATLAEVMKSFRPAARSVAQTPELAVLCRSLEQIEPAVRAGADRVYLDFEDIRRYREGVEAIRRLAATPVFLATPRIQKAGEQGFFKLIENAAPDGVLIRNIGAVPHFAHSPLRKIGDFSLNVANPVTAFLFLRHGLEKLTVSYDLNADQVLDLLSEGPAGQLEITLHQHMPMFHMEHCVFAAFLSEGTDHTNCGRPCESHRVHLRDRVGMEHPLRADVGCRNTLFNAVAQSGAAFYDSLRAAGAGSFRIELLEETPEASAEIVREYHRLLHGRISAGEVWRRLKVRSQLGVTKGTLAAVE
ncbi:MAG TPA: DUF3656 domain-containing protein [Chthoniobacterales bacterium]